MFGPVRTLERARDIVRRLRKTRSPLHEPIEVVIAPGLYRLTKPFVLETIDSGTINSPTIYKAAKIGSVTFSGAINLSPKKWVRPKADACITCEQHNKIIAYPMSVQLMKNANLKEFNGYALAPSVSYSELFVKGIRMPIARWPNSGFLSVKSVNDNNHNTFYSPIDLSKKILLEKNLWISGYWQTDWVDVIRKVKSINISTGMVEMATDLPEYAKIKAGARFFFLNVNSALDSPGEWFLDKLAGWLYFWPKLTFNEGDVEWSLLEHIILANHLYNTEFNGINFEGSIGDAIILNHVESVVIQQCKITAVGGWGVKFIQSKNSIVKKCELKQLGAGGIRLQGKDGNRITLDSSGLIAQDNIIYDYGQKYKSYLAGVLIDGVGVIARNNKIFNAPHVAIFLSGNDNLIEKNIITKVAQETLDSSAIYMSRDWTARGNVIRKNYIYNISSSAGNDTKGIYIDDQVSGTTIDGNVFWNVPQPVFISGGSYNKVNSNIFINSSPSITFDNRGMTWQKKESMADGSIWQKRLKSVPFNNSAIWMEKYPEIVNTPINEFGIPRGNIFSDNYFVKSVPYKFLVTSDVLLNQSVEKAKLMNFSSEYPAPDFGILCKYILQWHISSELCIDKVLLKD